MADGDDPKNLTREQYVLHRLSQQEGVLYYNYPNDDSKVRLASPAERAEEYNTFYTLRSDRLDPTSNENTVVYLMNKTRNFCSRISYHQEWPELKVRKEFPNIEICFFHNRGLATCREIKACINTQDGPSLNPHSSGAAKGFYCEKNQGLEQELLGNNDYEEQWTRHLPSSTTNPTLPWSWSHGMPSGYFPNFLLKKDDHFRFIIRSRREIWKLLRVREVKRDADGRVISSREYRRQRKNEAYDDDDPSVTVELLVKILEKVPSGGTLPQAILVGQSMDILKTERDRHIFCSNQINWLFEDYFSMKDKELMKYGNTASFKITTEKIIKVIFIMAENVDAKDRNFPTNYTSNASDIRQGWDVIASVTFWRDDKKVTLTLPMIKNLMREHFPSVPVTRGILAIPLCLSPRITEETVGISIGSQKNNTIDVKLADGSPFHNEPKNTRFRVRCILQILREITFTRESDGVVFNPTIN